MSLWELSQLLIEMGLYALPLAILIDLLGLGIAAVAVVVRRRG